MAGQSYGSKALGFEVVFDHSEQVGSLLEQRAHQVVVKTVSDVEAYMKQSMTGTKHGRTYVHRGIAHTASAPGEAPAIDEGQVVGGIHGEMLSTLQGEVTSSSEQGPYLNYGTSRMAARPFFEPAVEAIRPQFDEAVRQLGNGLV